MGERVEMITPLHRRMQRDYIGRMMDDKVECSRLARKYDREYWDGDRRFGYGGYHYDGRWREVARKLVERYHLRGQAKILDIGCGKGYLLYELKCLLPESEIWGFDVSSYALSHAKEEIRDRLFLHRAQDRYPFADKEFDLALSINTLHNLTLPDLKQALQEMERVSFKKYIVVEGYRNEKELFHLQCWALTCNSFFMPEEWEWLFNAFSFTGDYEFIFFE